MPDPIQHTVAFSLCHDAGSPAEEDFLETARSLATIPGVQAFQQHKQVSPKSSFTHMFTMTFADDETYRAYNNHPVHVGFVRDRWEREVTEFQELDLVAITPAQSPGAEAQQ